MATQQHHDRVGLGRDEAEEKDVATATVVALQYCLSQRTVLVQCHLFGLGPHQVVDDVAAKCTATLSNHKLHQCLLYIDIRHSRIVCYRAM